MLHYRLDRPDLLVLPKVYGVDAVAQCSGIKQESKAVRSDPFCAYNASDGIMPIHLHRPA